MGVMAPQLLIFDFDGTLADTWRDIATALNRTLREAGYDPVPAAQVRAWIGKGLLHLIDCVLPQAARSSDERTSLYARFCAHYERCCLDTTHLYPGVADCLNALSGHRLAILSNKRADFLDRMVAELGLADRFASVTGGDQLPFSKPDPRAVTQLAAGLDAALADTWVIGDSALDVASGRGAGARTIGCAWGLRGREELIAAHAEFVIDHPAEIPPLIAQRTAAARAERGSEP
jgi:phosphoglycolate phosphatase